MEGTRLRRTEAETSDLVLKEKYSIDSDRGHSVAPNCKGVVQSWWRVSSVSSLTLITFKFIILHSYTGTPQRGSYINSVHGTWFSVPWIRYSSSNRLFSLVAPLSA